MAGNTQFDAIAGRVRNWSRWGSEDERGTLNLIDATGIRRGASAVVDGQAIMLGLTLQLRGTQDFSTIPARLNPVRTMIAINVPLGPSPAPAFNDDIVVMGTQAATHWDALSHVSWNGRMYNDISADAVDYGGAARLGIDKFGAIATRGVLLDLARHVGVEMLPPNTPIDCGLLTACAAAQGVSLERGDILLVRTGGILRYKRGDLPAFRAEASGFVPDAAIFFHEQGVAAVASDTSAFDLMPSPEVELFLPMHILLLILMGMPIGESWDLEELAEMCAADRRYTFLLEASPEPFHRGTGGLVNPVAIR